MVATIAELRTQNETKTCAWCRDAFPTVPDLLDHVVDAHLPSKAAA